MVISSKRLLIWPTNALSLCISPAARSPPLSISAAPNCTSCVTALMFLIAVRISPLPNSCSCIACIMLTLMFFTSSEREKILLNPSSAILEDSESVSISVLKFFNVSVMVLPWADDSSESFLISSATTANPFPASPAWAASIAAFIASKLVWLAMFWITTLASKRLPDSSAIFWAIVPERAMISLPVNVAEASVSITLLALVSVRVIEAIFATICSIADEAWIILSDWRSIP